MLFKFLGNSDAPDWIISELNTLSYVSSVRIKFILLQVLNLLIEAEVDFDEIYRHLADAQLNESQTRSVLAVLSFIIQNAVRFNVDPEDLSQELQQLGTPLSHTSTITRFYRENRQTLRKYFRNNFQRFSEVSVFDFRSDIILEKKGGNNFPKGSLCLRFSPKNGNTFSFAMTSEQAEDLSRELKAAIEAMRSVSK
ncbi:COMM domain-containing protein 4 [Histomonas meleagridis]|uniref:COMM domain-containing protein 4 n=1 Tax=Histomonas meleagridis TaxID=135588 RepID=UPI00355A7CC7|nr:COMM domain-containing protein 4 [Histomonas meleagridis]KAH0802376.1 COMM domain-containing protein 4 [Histomonas meleagridis]